MRRVILAVTATVAGLVALLTFKTHSPERALLTPAGSPSSDSGAGVAAGTAKASGSALKLAAGQRSVDGNVANTVYGPVQLQVIVQAGKIVKVGVLEQPASTPEDTQIGQYAFPRLISETLTAQSARIDAVSGATYTSGGYVKSLQSALDNGA
jgi:uncharacterized protein with FMN-binding domain